MRTESPKKSPTSGAIARRSTRQRETVLGIVEASRTHPSAEEVYHLTRKTIPTISLATVYRNLNLLVAEGKIREVQFHGDVARYDGMLEAHEHFYCRACGLVIDLPASLGASALASVENKLMGSVEQYALDY